MSLMLLCDSRLVALTGHMCICAFVCILVHAFLNICFCHSFCLCRVLFMSNGIIFHCMRVCSPPADVPSSTASVWIVCLRLLLHGPHSILLVPRFPFASANLITPRRPSHIWGNAAKLLLTNHLTFSVTKTLPLKPLLIHVSLTFRAANSRKLRRSFCFSRYHCTAPCFSPRGPGGDPLSPPVPPSLLSSTPTILPCNSWAWTTCTADPHRQVC